MTPAAGEAPSSCSSQMARMRRVVANGAVSQLGQVLREQRSKKPDIQVCYHTLTVDQADPTKFELAQTHKVACIPKGPSGDNDNTSAYINLHMYKGICM